MPDRSRIPRTIEGFHGYMLTTANYLSSSPDIPARLGWLADEAERWIHFFQEWDGLFGSYTNKKAERTTLIKDKLLIVKRRAIKYEQEHHLLDRITVSPHATMTDFNKFHIKRGTPLQDTKPTRDAVPGIKEPVIAISKMKHLVHQLLVTMPEQKSRGKQKGVKDIIVYCATTNGNTPSLSDYQYYGDVKRGLINIIFEMPDSGKTAWYMARIKNSRGQLGPWSAPLNAIVP